jgi:hypothetical protein
MSELSSYVFESVTLEFKGLKIYFKDRWDLRETHSNVEVNEIIRTLANGTCIIVAFVFYFQIE